MVQASGAPVSEAEGHKCPACGSVVDSLRAGHVAIMEGRFQYFCNEHCKRELYQQTSGSMSVAGSAVETRARPLPSAVETEEPPQVAASQSAASIPVSATRSVSSSSRSQAVFAPTTTWARSNPDEGAPAEAPLDEPPVTLPSVVASPAAADGETSRAKAEDMLLVPPRDPAPTLPSADESESTVADSLRRSAGERTASPGLSAGSRVPAWLVGSGIAFGVLAALVPLAGRSADVLRVPLASLAVLVVALRALILPREVEAPHPGIAVGPVVLGLVAVYWGLAAGDVQALALASFAGLAAASVLTADWLVQRASAPTCKARERIRRGLDGDVRVVRGDTSVRASPFEVKPGEAVGVEAGDTLRVDGVVAAGEAMVLPWLDAPQAVKKKEGNPLIAGATVASGRLRVTTTWAGADRAFYRLALSPVLRTDVAAPLARGFRLIIERGAPVLGVLGAIAVYAGGAHGPLVLASASAVALALAARGAASVVSLHHARGQLSALALGIVYKDAAAFDAAGRVSVAVLCSRGTVLMGEPEIVALESLGAIAEGRVLSLAAGAEVASTHPFASAILRAARVKEERPDNVRSAMVHPGLGVTALAATGERLVVGSRSLLLREKVSVAIADARVTELETQGRSVLLVALAGKLIGLIAMQDGLRPGARAAVQRLLDAKLEPVLLSGEARETCETLGRALDIDHLRPEVLPESRGNEVRALGEGGQVVAVIGHPETDDAALGATDVAVALGAAGATPGEWSVSLASDDVRDAARALSFAKDARDRAKVAMALGVTPGIIAALAIAWGVMPIWMGPLALLAGTVAALVPLRA
jgi:Cu+-exporting ATPase